MNKSEIINIANEYAFSGKIHPVIECLNTLLESESQSENMDLIFMLISSTQLYGFLSYLSKKNQELFMISDYFRSNSYRGVEIPFYNRGQLSFLYELEHKEKVFFSAPTSFGKTSIVTEFILNNEKILNNIAIIVPTNSLLEELFIKFIGYNAIHKLHYNISTQPLTTIIGRNILLLTPERFMLMAELINSFDIIIMDETYKIVDAHNNSISDFVNNRSLRFRKVADIIASSKAKVIFLSPFTYSLTESMKEFLEKYNITKINRELEYVKREIIKLDSSEDFKNYFNVSNTLYKKNLNISQKCQLILSKLFPQNSIIYVSNYSKAYDIVKEMGCCYLKNKDNRRYSAFLKHIEENYLIDNRETWTVYDALKKGIGIYISPLPRYIKREIVKLYESRILTALIVTSAFTEGVNTCASNLIFTSLVNGPNSNKLSDIDVLNASGRAGRFAKNTVGRIYCINNEIYEKVQNLQKKSNINLENYNYKKSDNCIDYQIEMMDLKYLNYVQKEKLREQECELKRLGLSKSDINISLNVSNNWKIILYRYFLELPKEKILEIKSQINFIYEKVEGERTMALDYIFKDIKNAFENSGIEVFPHDSFDILPFDRKGKCIWARLYKLYISGSPKQVIVKNIKYISSLYNKITNGKIFSDKSDVMGLFIKLDSKWILSYYTHDLKLNMNAFYSETFKFISNIIQYKIPFYLTFYISIFNLLIKKGGVSGIDDAYFDLNKLINIFEDGETSEEYNKLIDYGLPILTVEKIIKKGLKIYEIKNNQINYDDFDEYEKIMIQELIELL